MLHKHHYNMFNGILRASEDKKSLPLRILGRLCPLAFSHIPRYAPFSKLTNPLQGCDPYGAKFLGTSSKGRLDKII